MEFEPTPQQRRFIETSVRSGRFSDEGEVLREGVELLRAHEMAEWRRYEAWMEETRERLRQGLEALDRGEYVQGEEVIRGAEERLERFRDEVAPDRNGRP